MSYYLNVHFQGQRVNMAQNQTPKRAENYPPSPIFPMAMYMWHFFDPLHFKASLLQALKVVDNVQKTTD